MLGFSVLSLAIVGFYFYVAVAFFRRATHDYPALGIMKRAVYAAVWPATVWDSPNNPAR